MAALDQKKNRKGLIQLGDKLGLLKGTTKVSSRPTQLGTKIPMLGEISYLDRKQQEEGGPMKKNDKARNRVARSAPGGSKEMM